ncbi:HD domain-containing protein [Siculibacillus lacustris]|uniref:HD domain-containing protein n=1 Tax=Siculibacillus lacustris TaxID=1549641 RepID=A0A4Q9VLJ9_9HYPH|nr:nucleotidyltransferase family protein [Siculibacillus lacustris]TBW36124.1 HD domain-containing protein [Siculibacillus lacustris]
MSGAGAGAAPVAAVVLAAGRSSRMGAFKPLLPLAGTTVIGHVVAALRAGGIDEIRVVIGHRAAGLAPVLADLGVSAVVNPDPDRGMYSSLTCGLAALPATITAALVLPVDVPLVRPATLAAIAARAARGDVLVVHPTFEGQRGHPPAIDRRLFAEILGGDGVGGLAAVLARHAAQSLDLPVIDHACLWDMDRPEDHARLAAAARRRDLLDPAEIAALFDRCAVAAPVRAHGRAVAARAVAIADGLADAGVILDRDLIAAAAELHDLAKGQPDHAEAGARILAEFGFAGVAAVVARHMTLPFADGDPIDAAVVVHLADKLVAGTADTSLEARFAAAFARFRDDPAALAGARRRHDDARAMLRAVTAVTTAADRRASP